MSDIQEKVNAAKNEAEKLKEKIKQKKDTLADTTRTNAPGEGERKWA